MTRLETSFGSLVANFLRLAPKFGIQIFSAPYEESQTDDVGTVDCNVAEGRSAVVLDIGIW